MQANIGKTDRLIRIIIGVIIIGVGIYFKTWWGALGLIPIVVALFRFCPLYVPLKINTTVKKV